MLGIIPDRRRCPHPPAGTFSPYGDGEKGLGARLAPFPATPLIGETIHDGVLLPSLYGEKMAAAR